MDKTDSRDFFMSYTGSDQTWAEWIAWHLEAEGYSTIIQAWDFRPGSNFVLEMDRASRVADKTVLVLSQASRAAFYTQPEWAAAFAKDLPCAPSLVDLPLDPGPPPRQGLSASAWEPKPSD